MKRKIVRARRVRRPRAEVKVMRRDFGGIEVGGYEVVVDGHVKVA